MAAPSRADPKDADGPIIVRVGRNSVRIYPRDAERGRQAGFLLADYSSGKRKQRWFTDLKSARAEATRIASLTNAGDTEGASMDGDDRRDFLRATELVAPFNLDVPTACALFAEAAGLVGAHAVVSAAKAYASRSPAARKRLPLATAANDYFDSKEAKGRSPRLLSDIRSRLGRFLAEHPGRAVGEFTTADIQEWIDKLRLKDGKSVSAQTRRNFATVLGGFFEHYRRRGAIPENPCRDLERDSDRATGDVEYWNPDEADALLRAAPPVVLPALVVALFCGVRTAELSRLHWQNVDLGQRHVEIKAGTAKTGSRRLVPIPDNALVWLLPLRCAPDSPLFREHPGTLPKRITTAAEAAGVRRIPNGARHSWFTFRCALTGDVARTALEGGNSPAVVHSHYRGLATAAEATRYFNIGPRVIEKVLRIGATP